MKKRYTFISTALLFLSLSCSLASFGQGALDRTIDDAEIRYSQHVAPLNKTKQATLRQSGPWKIFTESHPDWNVHLDERSAMPHRAYGKGIEVAGTTPEERAQQFITDHLQAWSLENYTLVAQPTAKSKKFDVVRFSQLYNGVEVLESALIIKLQGNKVVQFGMDLYPIADLSTTPSIGVDAALVAASAGISQSIESAVITGSVSVLPIPGPALYEWHLVYPIEVKATNSTGVPARYRVLVDAHSGEVVCRVNQVRHICPGGPHSCPNPQPTMPLAVDVNVSGNIHLTNPNDPAVVQGFPNVYVTVGGVDYPMDENGSATLPVNPNSPATVRLMGPWARVYTAGVTPQMSATLVDGTNDLSFDANANIKERTAYVSVQKIHDHMKEWMPEFTGMDYQLTTNVDEAGECNAFYNGISINFFDVGGGCNASSLIPDIAYHEYGHGINDFFYQDLNDFFQNGAMGEGYADFWAISLTNDPKLGVGFNIDNLDPIRRYDEDPKVYPVDLIGEVHADGEIIMGAWYDTHLLMGGDWTLTMPLFVEAYAGLQASTFDGNEGVAFTDVLLDALQADDDDANLSNGTPNGNAIVQGFYIHGITLLSNATLDHTEATFAPFNQDILVEASLDLQLGFDIYLQQVNCTYKVNNGDWITIPMTDDGGSIYQANIPGQNNTCVVYYYLSTTDINGSVSNVLPVGAALADYPNIPYIVIVGAQIEGIHDCDDHEDWGAWTTGLPGDNSSTGDWELETPMGSFTTDVNPGTVVAADTQVTAGGEFCFVTQNASNINAGIGESDVDGGRTTLQSSVIDMSEKAEPIVSYYRWYTNSPPGGANPGADFWQVRMSNDNGATWTYVENTKTSDASWRRNAFRVRDFMEPTATMKFQFIASDSIRPGQNLEGGSLVEAALDDFLVWDEYITNVSENDAANELQIAVYPNPASDQISISWLAKTENNYFVELINSEGKVVQSTAVKGVRAGQYTHRETISHLAAGIYTLRLKDEKMKILSTRNVVVE